MYLVGLYLTEDNKPEYDILHEGTDETIENFIEDILKGYHEADKLENEISMMDRELEAEEIEDMCQDIAEYRKYKRYYYVIKIIEKKGLKDLEVIK